MNKSFFNRKPFSKLADDRRIQLIKRINAELKLDIPLHAKIKSQNANRWWQGSGRFKWTFEINNNELDAARVSNYGSALTVLQLLKCDTLTKYPNGEIFGYNKDEIVP